MVHKAIREQLLPFARRHYPHLNGAFDKQPYPRPGNLFIVRYSAASGRPGGRGLKLHKDETALTFNMCLSPQDGFEGGGTYFPASSGDVDGILLRPTPGYCLVHDGTRSLFQHMPTTQSRPAGAVFVVRSAPHAP